MSKEVIKKLQKHDQKLEAISKKLDGHDKKLEAISKKLDGHDKQLASITCTVVDHTERFDRIEQNMATKSDIRDITDTLDVLVKFTQKKDQELTFMGSRVGRIEDDVKQIKPFVGLVH